MLIGQSLENILLTAEISSLMHDQNIHIYGNQIKNINFAQIRVANSAENFSVSGIFSGQTTENLNHYSVTTEQFHLLELPFLSEKMGSKH